MHCIDFNQLYKNSLKENARLITVPSSEISNMKHHYISIFQLSGNCFKRLNLVGRFQCFL